MAKKNKGQPAAEPTPTPEPTAATPEAQEDLEASLRDIQMAAASYFETLSDAAQRLANEAEQIYAAGQDQVRDHPSESILGAAAMGLLVGVLLDRM